MKRFLWASYGMYFLGGITSVFFGSIMPELLNYYHTSYTTGGFIILLQSIGFIIGVPLTVRFMKKYPYRFILSASAFAVTLAQFGILFLPHLLWIDALVILNGIGASALETAVASYIMELFKGRRAIYMSRLEVAFGLGALCMPVIASGLIALNWWRVSPLLVGLFALGLAVFWQFITVSLDSTVGEGERERETAAPPIFKGNYSKYSILSLFLLLIFLYVGVEGCLNSFLPSMFLVYVKTKPAFASLSSAVFWVAMVCGRMAISWIVQRVSYERYLFGSISIGILFFLVLTQNHTVVLSFLTVFGLGVALSAIYSITMVYANHTFPGMERAVTSAVTAFAGMGGAVFPAIFGFAIDHFSSEQVLWLLFGFAALLLVLFLLIYWSINLIRARNHHAEFMKSL